MTNTEKQKLITALKCAVDAVQELQNSDDGGTCNFDCPTIYTPKGTRESTMQNIATAAGVRIYKSWLNWRDCTEWHIDGAWLNGQGNRRTRIAEAFRDSLKRQGIEDCGVYYAID